MASEIVFPVGLVFRKVGTGAVLAEPLFFPEFARLGPNRAAAAAATHRNLLELIPRLDPAELIRRRRAEAARELRFTVQVAPPRANEAWRDVVELTFHAVVWEHPLPRTETAPPSGHRLPPRAGHVLARILELGIEVIANADDNLVAVLRRESLASLRRMNLSGNLHSLARLQTTQAFAVQWTNLPIRMPTLKDRVLRAETEGTLKKTVLEQVATPVTAGVAPAYEIEPTVNEIEKALGATPPQSVLLIGPSGVGKTAAVRHLAHRWALFGGKPPVYQTSGARIVAGQSGFGMWEQRCQDLIKDTAKRRAVLHVGSLIELMEVGKSEYNQSGIATFLRPAISRGELLCIAEATPEQLPMVEKQDPQLLDAFQHIRLEEPGISTGLAILGAFASAAHTPLKVGVEPVQRRRGGARKPRRRKSVNEPSPACTARPVSPAALAAIDRLHRRYATYSAYPGRPLRFLENLLRDTSVAADTQEATPISEEEVYAAFTRETGLPRAIIDPGVPLDVAATHAWFSARVVGQPEAVNLIVDLLATVKAGLTRPNRPIASLLFIGPTGVGKTEMAKALAEFLFGSKDRLTRFDMSEFADAVSVRRLIGGAFGTEGLLTAKVREQPFSVLLLDEVEKADASFFDLLLQALGEARLTDGGGRLADFRNTVVILTSNLGAESYRRGSPGFGSSTPTSAESAAHFARVVEQYLRPEMFNRLDRVVPFAPLAADTIRQITDREWHQVLKRDGIRFRELTITTAPELLDHVASIGFDPRYGARPLKRAMARELLAPLAQQLNRHSGDTPVTVALGVSEGHSAVVVRPVQGPLARSTREPTGSAGKLAATAQTLRRWHQLAANSSTVRELDNEVYQLTLAEQRIYRMQQRGVKLKTGDPQLLARLGRLREVAEEVKRQRQVAFALEDEAVIAFHDGFEANDELSIRLAAANSDWDRLLFQLYALHSPAADAVTLALFAEHRGNLSELAAAYRIVATEAGLTVAIMRYDLPTEAAASAPVPTLPTEAVAAGAGSDDPPTIDTNLPSTIWARDRLYSTNPAKLLLTRKPIDQAQYEEYCTTNTIGLGLSITGSGAHVRFAGEGGLHDIRNPEDREGGNPAVLVQAVGDPLIMYRPPEAVVRRGFLRDRDVRREYDIGRGTLRDRELDRVWGGFSGHLRSWLEPAIIANMRLRLLQLIVE